jgi:hypothetical protein
MWVTVSDDTDPFSFGPMGRRVVGGGLVLLMLIAILDEIRRRRK